MSRVGDVSKKHFSITVNYMVKPLLYLQKAADSREQVLPE